MKFSFIKPIEHYGCGSGMIVGASNRLMESGKAVGQPEQGAVERKESESQKRGRQGEQ